MSLTEQLPDLFIGGNIDYYLLFTLYRECVRHFEGR